MAAGNAVWGIDIGQTALKAVKLRPGGDQLELVAFDIIEHPKILSQPDADADELVRAALEKFASRNDWTGDQFVIGVPGQQTFARFCKLPPVDTKKIPDIVKFEASQQIPFDMDEVVWDYQVFSSPDSPDVEVGIFAIKKDIIRKQLDFFTNVKISPIAVQTHPSALYNFCKFDQSKGAEPGGATVIVDIGAQNTDLIIAEQNSAWSRNIPLGGNNFTEALVKSFKLSFAKAESLKKTAATSKYARQIFQAMRPVFADLVAEIQRSIGFYSSTHRDVELKSVLGLGNAFRLPGLQKYLENNLTIPGGVSKVEKLNMIVPSATVNAPQFTDNVLSFGVAYGLALQGLGLAAISANLLPQELARIALWNQKRPMFIAAAACLALSTAFVWGRQFMDEGALASGADSRARTQTILASAAELKQQFDQASTNTGEKEEKIKRFLTLNAEKRLVPLITAYVLESLPDPAFPELAKVRSGKELKELIASDKSRYARPARKQFIIESFSAKYTRNINDTEIPATQSDIGGGGMMGAPMTEGFTTEMGIRGGGGRMFSELAAPSGGDGGSSGPGGPGSGMDGFIVRISGRLLYGTDQKEALDMISREFYPRLLQLGQRKGLGFHILDSDPKNPDQKRNPHKPVVTLYYPQAQNLNPMMQPRPSDPSAQKPLIADPVTDEDMSTDWRFQINFKIKIGDKPEQPADANANKGD